MREERISLNQRERDRLKVRHEVQQGHLKQVEASPRLRLSTRQVRRLERRVEAEGARGWVHRLRGRASNRKIPAAVREGVLAQVRRRYCDFGPTLAAEKLTAQGQKVSRETLRKWRSEVGLWRPRRQRVRAVQVWRERRAAFGELVMRDRSPFRGLEPRGPELQLIALIDEATSRVRGRVAEHDSTEENLRTLEGWLRRHGRPGALYTDKDSIFVTSGPPQRDEQLQGRAARTPFGRALGELGIEWIPAHSPQAKGRSERRFRTFEDRLVKEMRLAEVSTIEEANQFLERVFLPFGERRYTQAPRQRHDAHRPLGRDCRLEQVLSVREPRCVAQDYTVRWKGQTWALPRAEVRAGWRGARIEVERRLDGSLWARFRGSYLSLKPCPLAPPRPATPFGLRPPGVAEKPKAKTRAKHKYIPPPDHPWRRTFLPGQKPDISTLR